ncbi:hypothetical protein GCM10022215_24540 [Nocardioides fonticola]|uniref:Uncharacterized protein n=1 Tax=Nocardioides fonticola TaxID=450363 RepID=A0ABP7XMN1_9ACTN
MRGAQGGGDLPEGEGAFGGLEDRHHGGLLGGDPAGAQVGVHRSPEVVARSEDEAEGADRRVEVGRIAREAAGRTGA